MRFSLLVLLTITGLDLSLSHAAIAADMPVKAPVYAPPLVPAPYNWTGVFLSTNFGGSWSNGSASIVGTAWNPGATAFIGGFELGYNWQIGHFLIGVEGDFDGSVFGLPNATLLTPLGPVRASAHQNWISTVAALVLPVSTGARAVPEKTRTPYWQTLNEIPNGPAHPPWHCSHSRSAGAKHAWSH